LLLPVPKNVENIDDYRPHISVFDKVENCHHVAPVALLERIESGSVPVCNVDESMIRALVAELLGMIE